MTRPERGIWSEEHAERWEDAYVTGNGRMGAMLFGDPERETLVANHCRLFLPLGSDERLADLAPHLAELRALCRAGDYKQALEFCRSKRPDPDVRIIPTDPFHPGLFVHVEHPRRGAVRDYARTENFATGEVTVNWADDGGQWQRRLFVSRADNLIVFSLTGSSAFTGSLIFPPVNPTSDDAAGGWTVGVDADKIDGAMSLDRDMVCYHNRYAHGKGGYDAAVRICCTNGSASVEGHAVRVTGADEVLVLIQIVPWKTPLSREMSEACAYDPDHTDFRDEHLGRYVATPGLAESSVVAYRKDEDAEALMAPVRNYLNGISADYDKLLQAHRALHEPLYLRASLELGASPSERRASAEQLLDTATAEGRLPLALAEKIYDAGRYMFLCCAGELAPNLQGIWTGSWVPAWSGDFTLDTNLQLAVKHGFSGNYAELMAGYFGLMESFYPEWELNAKRTYGCRGYLTNARASNTALMLHWGTFAGIFWTAGCSWLARPFYDYYAYTGDREFLATRAVPLLLEVAAFYEDFVVVDEQTGLIDFMPSYSPETGYCTTATMDVMCMRDTFTCLIKACRELDIHQDRIDGWQALLAKLPPYTIREDGALSEWIRPHRDEADGHRHLSHLHAFYEATGEITAESDPALFAAARKALDRRINADGEQSTHGRVHMGLAAAEMGLAEEAYGRLELMATRRSMVPSLMCTHEPDAHIFNLDGNGAIPEIMRRMLFRTRPGALDLLPALPAAWPRGTLTGARAKGQIAVEELSWDVTAGTAVCRLVSGIDQTVALRWPGLGNAIVTAEPATLADVQLTGCEISLEGDKPTCVRIGRGDG